jgi:hypothetical protein
LRSCDGPQGTVKHATVLASLRDLTKAWSYAAYRGPAPRPCCTSTRTAAALERTELGGADLHDPPDRAPILTRARAQRLVDRDRFTAWPASW